MKQSRGLRVEALEQRDTPATFGIPWPDGEHLTLSFAPDGTSVGGQPSVLSQLGPAARFDALRAFQAWAAQADVNFGLVADDGSGFGVGGPTQGDPRFGDVRVGGVPLAADVLAVTAPYSPFGSYSGDVTVNTAAGFGPTGPELYTALLQEAGHALGVGNSTDPASVMYEYYRGPRTGFAPADVAAVQSLYGPRVADRYEGPAGNETPATAANYAGPLTAELTTAADVDVYRFTTGLLTQSVTVDLRAAGLSLVTAKVELLDAAGNVTAANLAPDPTANDVTLSSAAIRPLATYYVRVSAARSDDFGVGAYGLTVTQHSLLSDLVGVVPDLLAETGLNDTLAAATALTSRSPVAGPQTDYSAQGGFGSASDTDVYAITVPPAGDAAVNLLATVWGQRGAVLNPWVEAYDATGRRLAAEVLVADGGTTTVQLRGLTPGQAYFLKLTSDSHAKGAYTLAADLRADAIDLPAGPGKTLADAPAAGGLYVPQTGQVHLVLAADGPAGGAGLVVTAADGTVVATLAAAAGRSRSLDLFLTAGIYSFEFRNPAPTSPVVYRFAATAVTDPVGATPTDPTGDPQPTGPPPASPPPGGYTPTPITSPPPPPTGEDPAFWY